MECRDVGVADERLGVSSKHFRLQMRVHPRGAVPAGAADHGLYARVEPHSHEVLGAPLVLHSLEASHRADLAVEDNTIASALERFHAPGKPPLAWGVRWR